MPRKIRKDLDGVVQAYEYGKDGQRLGAAYSLPAGADVPEGVSVPEALLQPDLDAAVEAISGGGPLGEFDPSKHNRNEVNEYLERASDAERIRVLQLELDGEQRAGVLKTGPFAAVAKKLKPTPPPPPAEPPADPNSNGGGQ